MKRPWRLDHCANRKASRASPNSWAFPWPRLAPLVTGTIEGLHRLGPLSAGEQVGLRRARPRGKEVLPGW